MRLAIVLGHFKMFLINWVVLIIKDFCSAPQSSISFLLMMGKEHTFVDDFICLFNIILPLWSQNYLISQLNQMSLSVSVLEELYKTHWTFTASVECLSFCLIDFVDNFPFNVPFLFEIPTALQWCGFFHNAKIVSQQSFRYVLYWNRETSLCHAGDLVLFCLTGIVLLEEWRADQIHHIKPACSTENVLALSGFQMKWMFNWLQNWNAKQKMLLQGAVEYEAEFLHWRCTVNGNLIT